MTIVRSIKRATFVAAAAAALSFAVGPAMAAGAHNGGHGHGKEKSAHSKDGHAHSFDFGEPGKAAEATRAVEVVMKENFYEPESIAVEAGETIRFKIVNKGELVHEFNLGTAKMHAAHQKEMMMMVEHGVLEPDKINHAMMKMDMGGGKTMEHDDPNSVLLEPGKSGEIVWKFTKAVELEFACNVPGHYESGMMGRIRFK